MRARSWLSRLFGCERTSHRKANTSHNVKTNVHTFSALSIRICADVWQLMGEFETKTIQCLRWWWYARIAHGYFSGLISSNARVSARESATRTKDEKHRHGEREKRRHMDASDAPDFLRDSLHFVYFYLISLCFRLKKRSKECVSVCVGKSEWETRSCGCLLNRFPV